MECEEGWREGVIVVGSSGGMEGDFTLSLMDGWSELTGGAKKMMKGRKASGQEGGRRGHGLWERYVPARGG